MMVLIVGGEAREALEFTWTCGVGRGCRYIVGKLLPRNFRRGSLSNKVKGDGGGRGKM